MGWNTGYSIMEQTIVAVYDTGNLTKKLLDKLMEPYKGTDCDSGGSQDLKAADGKSVEEIICSIMKPEEYEDVIKKPEYYPGTPAEWRSNEKAGDLFETIWSGMWGIWQTT